MKVALGTFARSGLEARLGSDLAAGVRAALLYYAGRLESGQPPPEYPRFRRGPLPEGRWPGLDLDLQLDAGTRAALWRAVRRQGVPLALVVEHAVLVYLAYLDRDSSPEFV